MSEVNYLEMSDEDMLNQPTPQPAKAAAPVVVEQPVVVDTANTDPVVVADPANPAVVEQDDDDAGTVVKNDAVDGDADPELDAEGNPVVKDPANPTPATEAAIDYKAAYESLIGAPIKAAGKEIVLKDADEAKRLIQMGADYHRRNEQMKPMRRVTAMLEKAGVKEEDISFLLDLKDKKPEAIAKLLSGSDINPISLDADLAATYQPTDHRVSDNQLNLDDAIMTLESTDHGKAILDDVGAKWDQQSRQMAVAQPEVLGLLADHKEAGHYDKIVAEVDRQKTFGRLSGVPFLTAYKQVGDMLNEHGLLVQNEQHGDPKQLVPPAAATQAKPAAAPVAVRPATPVVDPAAARAKAAAATKGKGKPDAPVVDYLNMSDADFAKLNP